MDILLEKHFKSWIDNLSNIRDLSENTVISYKNDIQKFFDFLESHLDSSPNINNASLNTFNPTIFVSTFIVPPPLPDVKSLV